MLKFALLLLTVSLSTELTTQENMSPSSLELMQLDLEFGIASASLGIEGWMSFFAEDASIFPPGQPIVSGIDAIRSYYEETDFDPRTLSWKPVKAEISSTGDIGYTFGYWEMKTVSPAGETQVVSGKYVTVWKKQKDGSWKVVVDIGNR